MVEIVLTFLQELFLAVALVSLAGIIIVGYLFRRFSNFVISLLESLERHGMEKDELREMIQREFVLLCNDDALFRKHIEKRIVGDKNAKKP